jgi:hypothetical protein
VQLARQLLVFLKDGRHNVNEAAGNTKGGIIIVPLTSCLTGLESDV